MSFRSVTVPSKALWSTSPISIMVMSSGHGGAVHGGRGVIETVGLALDDTDINENADSLLIGDLIGIGKISVGLVRSGSADDHHAQEHNRSREPG